MAGSCAIMMNAATRVLDTRSCCLPPKMFFFGACSQLRSSLAIENVTVNFANFVPAGTNLSSTQDFNLSSCGYRSAVVTSDMCRVAMYVAASYRSGITAEAWLPTNWTGRFLSTGNGGVSGCIQYPDLAYTAGLGFATVGANNGHNGTRGYAFANNNDVVEDFAIRSLHTGVVVGKQITQRFYGSAHKKSYYLGCSTGGRQGFKSVQAYPLDFDGVLAGAPAFNYPNLNSWSNHFYPIFGDAGDETYVPAGTLWGVIHREILAQCDGLIEDPELCRFRPEALQCAPGTTNSSTCLTCKQVEAVRAALTDFYGVDGKLIYPRMQPGSEAIASVLYYAAGAFSYSSDWFKFIVVDDSNWDPATFTIADAKVANEQNPFDIATWNGDISAYKNNGGKLLHYHGQMGAVITSENSPLMSVSSLDTQNNVLLRVVDWVENGNAPETVTGTRFVDNDRTKGVAFTRNHCKYPKRNTCTDPARYTEADAWTCV
ncbi:hypothetical protein DL95DRAFT_494557 [Leptodontidium sp. 2 PMI_412]|nr:hypothetical protein DL95DRAFT_494557 [Leptodontidium sp. 2 PMI_412]